TLSRLSNFIPEAGIWMNTQRPEWNDANNALVGNGVSMVTLCYLRRFLIFFKKLVSQLPAGTVRISSELLAFHESVLLALDQHQALLSDRFSNQSRRELVDALGTAGSDFRQMIYDNGFSGSYRKLAIEQLSILIDLSLRYMDHSIAANERVDHMYHAYNLMSVEQDGGISVDNLSEMLEGQVAVLSAGALSPLKVLQLLEAMKTSRLFRKDQYSYMLYPNKQLPSFMQKNILPESALASSALLRQLLADGDRRIVEKDSQGQVHFNGDFKNAGDVEATLEQLQGTSYAALIDAEKGTVLEQYEAVFNHKAFTGRSGTFFGYEGLGSIYWHMVSKLLLAVQECCL
ncbi:MAG: hypothetical protein AAFO94_21930, partial [Bacteroidota bacterium]